MRASAHSAQQVPKQDLLFALEVRGSAPLVREMRVRAVPRAHAQDEGDPRSSSPPPACCLGLSIPAVSAYTRQSLSRGW